VVVISSDKEIQQYLPGAEQAREECGLLEISYDVNIVR
jgi:hypothetical protein